MSIGKDTYTPLLDCSTFSYRCLFNEKSTCLPIPSLAPEHKFPTGVHDCYDALLWSLKNSATLNATPSRGLLVGGASAGGNIAAVLALLARDEKLSPPITGQYLCVPALLPDTNVPPNLVPLYLSRTQSTNDPVLKGIPPGMIEEIYAPDPKSPLWDPFNHPDGH